MFFLLTLFLALQSPTHDPFAALREQWVHNLHEKKIDACVAQYAPDADFFDPSGAVHSSDGLRQLFTTVTQTYDSDLHFTSSHTETSGDLAYDSGSWQETLVTRATGKSQNASGSYLTVYRRSHGQWLIVQQMWIATGGNAH
jgi:ketosteroid isomerase-like protein